MRPIKLFYLLVILSLVLTACSFNGGPASVNERVEEPTPMPESMVTFRLTIPEPLPAGESVNLVVLDELTGLPFNQQHYPMQLEDNQHLVLIRPFPVDGVIKYRYDRQGTYSAQEYGPDARPVRYRMLVVDGPELVEDIVSRWVDTPFAGSGGRITGQVVDSANQQPLAGILIAAGGMQTITTADGSFRLEGLPAGVHNLVAYAMDGSYRPFQQGATVSASAETPTMIVMQSRPRVNLVFTVSVPEETPPGSTLRFAGNFRQFGNTFSNQMGEISVVAALAPALTRLPDGRYTITLELPVGAELIYRYTLGDGLWNAEHTSSGEYRQRRIIVPEQNELVEDVVTTWRYGRPDPVNFYVVVPENSPPNEHVSIQFNPGYGWTEPIPMWSLGNNAWTFTLFSPLVGLSAIDYRYCRDVQCGSADEAGAQGILAKGRTITLINGVQNITDQVDTWAWWNGVPRKAVVPSVDIPVRSPDFVTGVAFQAEGYHSSWDPLIPAAVQEAAVLNSNWIFYTPTWTSTQVSPSVFEAVPGFDPDAQSISSIASQARNLGIQTAFFPAIRFTGPPDEWWLRAPRDFSWWVSFFEAYRRFILNFADMAAKNGAISLVIGGEWLEPALPNGRLADGSSSGVPQDAEQRWRNLIAEIRSRYGGLVLWALNYPEEIQTPPAFLDQVDGLYVLWSAQLVDSEEYSNDSLTDAAGKQLDEFILPLNQDLAKPVILAVGYPSASGAVSGCVVVQEGTCASFSDLSRPKPDLPGVVLDLEEQEAVYNAMLKATNTRPWINGFVSQGFYPALQLQDKSISIRGKPTAGVVWYWFGRFLGR
jgi:hypothetical protein